MQLVQANSMAACDNNTLETVVMAWAPLGQRNSEQTWLREAVGVLCSSLPGASRMWLSVVGGVPSRISKSHSAAVAERDVHRVWPVNSTRPNQGLCGDSKLVLRIISLLKMNGSQLQFCVIRPIHPRRVSTIHLALPRLSVGVDEVVHALCVQLCACCCHSADGILPSPLLVHAIIHLGYHECHIPGGLS